MRGSFIRIKDARRTSWRSGIAPGSAIHQEMRVWVRILALCKKKITGRHLGVMTWVWPGPLRVSEVQGRNTCYKGGVFSEDSLLSSFPMSFYLLLCWKGGQKYLYVKYITRKITRNWSVESTLSMLKTVPS